MKKYLIKALIFSKLAISWLLLSLTFIAPQTRAQMTAPDTTATVTETTQTKNINTALGCMSCHQSQAMPIQSIEPVASLAPVNELTNKASKITQSSVAHKNQSHQTIADKKPL